MAERGGRSGFDAGQAVAHERTLKGDWNLVATELKTSSAVSSILSLFAEERGNPVPLPPTTATVKAGIPTKMTLPPEPVPVAQQRVDPLVMDAQVYAQKTADRSRWVDYYKSLT